MAWDRVPTPGGCEQRSGRWGTSPRPAHQEFTYLPGSWEAQPPLRKVARARKGVHKERRLTWDLVFTLSSRPSPGMSSEEQALCAVHCQLLNNPFNCPKMSFLMFSMKEYVNKHQIQHLRIFQAGRKMLSQATGSRFSEGQLEKQ